MALPAVAGFPLWHFLPINFTDAYFEAASGLTTTGGTVLSGLEFLPRSINLWRHLLSWLGGMGIIVLAVAILPMLGVGGMQIYRAEMPGPMKDSKLTPRIGQTAKLLWAVYAGLTAACIGCLRFAGMNWFDAVCHGFSALALGGFSTYDASIGHFNSLPIEMVLTDISDSGGLEFRHALSCLEPARSLGVFPGCRGQGNLGDARGQLHRHIAVFVLQGQLPRLPHAHCATPPSIWCRSPPTAVCTPRTISRWPIFAPMWMMFLSCIVASSGSTGGGIKMIRTLVLAKQAHRELNQLVHPNMVRPLKVGGTVIANRVVFAVLAFVFLYFMSIVTLIFLQLASGLDFHDFLVGHHRLHQQRGPGLRIGGPGQQLRRVERLSDLGVLGGHAARPAGGFHDFGAVHAHFVAEIARRLSIGIHNRDFSMIMVNDGRHGVLFCTLWNCATQ